MRNRKLTILIVVWVISILALGTIQPTYLVESLMSYLDFDFASKEAYVLAVEIVRWSRRLYFVGLALLTFYLFNRGRLLPS